MAKPGSEYEKFVYSMQKAILDADEIAKQKNIAIELNKKIIDKNGITREFDLYWEYELGGLIYKTVVECKDYNSLVSIERIDALVGKLHDIPDLKGIFATKKGYQTGALKKAQENNIELLVIREQNDSDWVDKDGNIYIKIIHNDIIAQWPAEIHDFQPRFDLDWIKDNTDIDITKSYSLKGLNTEILIEDIEKNKEYSLFDLQTKLLELENEQPGDYEKLFELPNAYLTSKGGRVKISAYKVRYSISKPVTIEMEIDYSKELFGVIEYLQKGIKKAVFQNGIVVDR
jgi:hypothetical protein